MPESEARHWKTTNEMADFFGITKQTFVKVRAKYVAAEHKRKRGREIEWYSPGVVQAWIEHELQKQSRPEDDDPMMAGGVSPALERYRLARAEKEEYNLQVMKGELIHVNDFLDKYGQLAAVLRGAQERMKKNWPEAHRLLDQAMGRFEEELTDG